MIRTVKERDNYQWHQWYAWYPIWISRGKEKDSPYYLYTYAWFERIWRKKRGSWGGDDWIYSVENPYVKAE